jgi:hypothetical protein
MTEPHTISRRQVLNIAAGAAGASITGAATVIGTSAAQAGLSKQAAKYQDQPKGDQRCDNCTSFAPPLACKLLDGTILPNGWCTRWAKGR